MPFTTKSGEEFISDEKYFVVRTPDEKVFFDNMSVHEKQLTKEGKWWSVDDLRLSGEAFFVDKPDLLLENIISGHLPPTPQEI